MLEGLVVDGEIGGREHGYLAEDVMLARVKGGAALAGLGTWAAGRFWGCRVRLRAGVGGRGWV